MKFFTVLLLFVAFASCKSKNTRTGIFNTDSLPPQQYSINTERDTVLKTANGAVIEIPKGSIVANNGNIAVLDIKEAYSLAAMIKAGLTTSSNGQPLSSGGMIYINAAAGQKLTITKKLRVAIPADYLTAGMQLYKGDTSKGDIDWVKPEPLPENKQLATLNEGKLIFQQSCASCHAIGKDLTGPDLAHFEKRFPYGEASAHYWTHNFTWPRNIIADTSEGRYYEPDLYACRLRAMYGSIGPLFPQLKFKDWKAIYDYIQTQSDSLNLPLPSHAWLKSCTDSCLLYKETISGLQYQKQMALDKKNGLLDNNRIADTSLYNPTGIPPVNTYDQMVSPDNYSQQYYEFTIDAFGWFNIDILMKDLPGMEQTNLLVRIQGEFHNRLTIRLIIPSIKLNIEGGPATIKDEYAFYNKDGAIPLPQNTDAWILAYSDLEDKIAFTLERFTTGKQQSLSLELKQSTKQEFNSALKIFEKEGLKIKVVDAQNAPGLRSLDTNIKSINQNIENADRLKPKNCDCNCGDSKPAGYLIKTNDFLDVPTEKPGLKGDSISSQ